ncbi:ribonuclease H-like domain-containing protein [Lactifluus subvellereus]|nr:ribonuclease H-like domain-containing protein [Lactifluus subvellereus]
MRPFVLPVSPLSHPYIHRSRPLRCNLYSSSIRWYTGIMPKAGYYAVKIGKRPGIYTTWEDCREQVDGYPCARYKKMATVEGAEAWMQGGASPSATGPVDQRGAPYSMKPQVRPANRLPGQTKALIVAQSEEHQNLSERCPGTQTNNRAELIAIIRALETISITLVPLVIKSDSEYAIKCFTDWLPGWRRNNFTTSKGAPVKNVELIMYMDALLSMRGRSGQQVLLEHVRGHAGEVGNEGADALAVRGATLPRVEERDWDALRFALEKGLCKGPSPL